MGYSLRRTVCVTRMPACPECILYRSCMFPYFFETPPDPEAPTMRRYQNAPHPFLLVPGMETQEGNVALGFVLIGKANTHLPVFVHALTRAAESERGISGNRLQLKAIEQESIEEKRWVSIYEADGSLRVLPACRVPVPPAPKACTVFFLTPLRIKRDGRRVGPKDLRFSDFFVNLLRRVSMMCSHQAGKPLEADFVGLKEAAHKVEWQTELAWKEFGRYSSRQKTAMQMGGVLGRALIQGVALEPFWPFLWLGQWIHAGSGATMGLGKYRLVASKALLGPPDI